MVGNECKLLGEVIVALPVHNKCTPPPPSHESGAHTCEGGGGECSNHSPYRLYSRENLYSVTHGKLKN
jgi:hypothetical protein